MNNMRDQERYEIQRLKRQKKWRVRRRRQRIGRIIGCICFLAVFVGSVSLVKNAQNMKDNPIMESAGKEKKEVTETTTENSRIEETSFQKAVDASKTNNNVPEEYEEYLEDLVALVKKDSKATPILEHIEEYPVDLIHALSKNDELLDFVLDYPDKKDQEEDIEITENIKEGTCPELIQWDERWGYLKYGDNIMAVNGCGPTCLSMVVMGLTGDKEQTPKAIADFSNENGYYFESGTSWELMMEGASQLGLGCQEVGGDANSILTQLEMGHMLIVSVGPGDFTSAGHYIVVESANDDGTVNIHDPNSKKRSAKEWEPSVIASQAKNIWAYWKN